MKTKLSLITLFTCALAGTSLFADNENYDEKKFSYGEDFSRRELANSSWIGATLEGAMFSGATLSNADFTGANLEYAWFDNDSDVVDGVAHSYKITLTNTKFVSANLSHAYFWGADLTGCSFENANVTGANFSQSNLTVEQLQSTKTYKNDKNLSWMDLSHLDMLNADFSGITFFYTDFYDTALTGANFENAIIGEGTSFSHTRITTEQLCKTKTYKEEKSFSGVEFGWSDLSEIDFSKFILENTSFWGTTLEGVNFSEANLSNVSFTRYLAYSPAGMIYRGVDATNANFTCANLTGTRFYGVNLTKSDFRGSIGSDLGEITTSSSMSTNWGTNVILSDGTIKNFTLISGESWIIRSSGVSKISAKLTGENTVTGGTLIISSGVPGISTLEIGESDTLILDDGKIITEGENAITIEGTLFVEKNSELCISATSNSGSSIFLTETGNIVFSETAKIVIDFDGYFEGEQEFSIITNRSNRSVDIDNISLNVNGSSYNTGLWKYAWNNGVLVVTLQTSDLTEDFLYITDPRQEIIISEDGFRGVFSGDLSEFFGSVSGKGSLNSSGTLVFSGDASAHSGTTEITSGTFTVAESAKIGTGSFDVEGTMAISGIRAFSNPTSGNGTLSIVSGTTTFTTDIGVKTLSVEQGASATLNAGVGLMHANGEAKVSGTLNLFGNRTFSAQTSGDGAISLVSGSNVLFTKPVGVKTLSVGEGATLRGGVEMAHGADAELLLAGALVLNADKGEKVSLGGGKLTLADSAKLDVVGNTSSARASATPIAALESGQEIVLIENGMVSGDVLAFLRTDADLLAYSQNCAVVYDVTNGLKVKVITDLTTPTGDVDLSELSTSFVDWVLSGTNKILLEENKGFVSVADFGSGLSSGNDPLLKAILSGDEGTARTILDRLSPKSYAVMAAMSVEAFNSDVRSISVRLEQRRLEAFDEKTLWEFFAQAQINSLENDMATDAPTFDFDTMGVLAGADYRVDAETTLGVAVGAGTGEAKIHNGGGKIESTDFRLTGFAGKTSEKCFVNAGVQLGCTSYDIKRNTDYGNASGDTTGWSAGLFSDVGTVVTLSEPKKIYATPYIGLAYMHTQADAFTESGIDKAFDADSISGDSLRVRLGCGFTWNFALASANWHAGLDVAFSHDFLGDEVDIDVTTKSGEKISETAKALPEDMFSIGSMLSVDVSPSASIYGGYTFNAGTDSSVTHSANLGFRMRF